MHFAPYSSSTFVNSGSSPDCEPKVSVPYSALVSPRPPLPSLTTLSLWLLEWSGMSRRREWWEWECLALRLSASAAVSVLPLRVNFPGNRKSTQTADGRFFQQNASWKPSRKQDGVPPTHDGGLPAATVQSSPIVP